jgi:hypothetical protein
MAIPRLPVYMWSPRRPGVGLLRHIERAIATVANRASVGTTLIQRGAFRASARIEAEIPA